MSGNQALCRIGRAQASQLPRREMRSSIPSMVKQMTYKIDTCHILALHSILICYGKDWLVQCQDNVTGWDIGSWCWWPSFAMGQYYKVAMSSTVTSQYPSCYDSRCCQAFKLQQPTNHGWKNKCPLVANHYTT